jgi:hypothetical protein
MNKNQSWGQLALLKTHILNRCLRGNSVTDPELGCITRIGPQKRRCRHLNVPGS